MSLRVLQILHNLCTHFIIEGLIQVQYLIITECQANVLISLVGFFQINPRRQENRGAETHLSPLSLAFPAVAVPHSK